jgi:hypothetical protein
VRRHGRKSGETASFRGARTVLIGFGYVQVVGIHKAFQDLLEMICHDKIAPENICSQVW